MDKRKFFITLIVTLIIFVLSQRQCLALDEDLKKPLLQLPNVTINSEQNYQPGNIQDDVSEQKDAEFKKPEGTDKKEDYSGFISGAAGSFNSHLYELKQMERSKTFYYCASLSVNESSGDRTNSRFTVYRPSFEIGMPLDEGNGFIFNLRYFDKIMGLPGKVDSITDLDKRRNRNTYVSTETSRVLGDFQLKATPYYELSLMNDADPRPDYKHKVIGARLEFERQDTNIDVNISQNRLINNYETIIVDSKLRLAALDINERLQFLFGANLFMQEKFGQRPAPFAELVFKRDEDTLHKITLTREFEPLIFSQVYLDDNYIEVNPVQLRPRRKSGVSYQLDKYVSPQWRANVLIYMRQDKDMWFWNDDDNDGLYSPALIEKANFSGITLSTEYIWSEAFSHFFSLSVRKIRSKDSRYEFFPFEPKQRISMGLDYKIDKKCKINFVGEYFGRRYYSGISKESSSGYFIIGSKLTYSLKDYLTFYALIDNLLNDHYEIVKGYPSQGRSVMSGVMVKF